MSADAMRRRAAATERGGALSPRAVTRGESQTASEVAKVDWLNCTFDRPELTPAGFVSFIGRMMGRPVSGHDGRGMLGFQTSVKLYAYVAGSMVECGMLAYGGDSQRGRWLFQLTGKGCGLVNDWPALADFLEGLGARITRLDLAVDFLNGEHTVDDAVEMHAAGGFTLRGRPPSTHVAGDWLERLHGRTLYIGKATNGKTLRAYEKGKQLGDLESPWVRFEVQLGNRDREIPFEALTSPTAFFAGCYPALSDLVDVAAEAIDTTTTEGETTLAHLLYHAKRCYGKLLHTLLKATGVSHSDLIEEVRVIGIPRRVDPAGVDAGLTWAEVGSLARKVSQ